MCRNGGVGLDHGDEIGFSLRGRDSGGGNSMVWFRVHGDGELGPITLGRGDTEALATLIDALTRLLSGAVELSRVVSSADSPPTCTGSSRPSGVHPARSVAQDE
jgi:hypothetical protein